MPRRWAGASLPVLLLFGLAPLAHAQTVLQLTGNGSDTINYFTLNDFSGVIEGNVSQSGFNNSATFSGPTGSATYPLGSAVTLTVSDIDLLPAGTLSGSTITQPLAGTGNLAIDVTNSQNTSATLLSAHVAGGEIFGTQGSNTATLVLNLSSLSSGVLSSLPSSSTPTYLEFTGTTSVPLALSLQCYGFSGLSGCNSTVTPNELALNSMNLNWNTALVTTTAPTIPSNGPRAVQFINGNSGLTNLAWSDQGNWVSGSSPTAPQPGDDVHLTNPTTLASQLPVIVNFDATNLGGPSGALHSLTIDSNAGGALLQLSQSANGLASGNETIGTTGTAEHLQTGGTNTVSGTLTVNGFGTYALQGGSLSAGTIQVNAGGTFSSSGGSLTYSTLVVSGGGAIFNNQNAAVLNNVGIGTTLTVQSGGILSNGTANGGGATLNNGFMANLTVQGLNSTVENSYNSTLNNGTSLGGAFLTIQNGATLFNSTGNTNSQNVATDFSVLNNQYGSVLTIQGSATNAHGTVIGSELTNQLGGTLNNGTLAGGAATLTIQNNGVLVNVSGTLNNQYGATRCCPSP